MRRMITFCMGMGCLLGAEFASFEVWAKPQQPATRNPGLTSKPPGYAKTPADKKLRLDAAKELKQWLSPLSPKHREKASLRSVMQWVQTWIASRWGLRLNRPAWKRWTHMTRLVGIWQPAPLYRDIRKKRLYPRLFANLRGMKFKMTAPKPKQKWRARIGTLQFNFGLTPLKRKRARDRRPYRFVLNSSTRIQPIYTRKLDTILLFLLRRFTNPTLSIPLTDKQKQFLSTMPTGHSQRIARWLNSRVPHTAALIRRYMTVIRILEPMGKGLYKLDLRARWKLKAFKKDYPRAARILLRQKTDFHMQTAFHDSRKRLWFLWSYERKNMEQRYQAVISKDGFWLCNKQWKPIAGPMRPTQMGSVWTTSTSIKYLSTNLKILMKGITLRWYVKGHSNGATLGAALVKTPAIQIQGGRLIRLLARILISGGISGMMRRFFKNLAYGDGGQGLRWSWRLTEGTRSAAIDFVIALPIVPDSTLTTLLRLGPSMVRRSRRGRRKRSKRRRRRRYPPIWNRIFRAIHKDLRDAHTLLAQANKK